LSPEQVKVLFEAAQGGRLEALYVLAVRTELRQGELLALKWDDVNLEVGTLQVRRTLVKTKGGPCSQRPTPRIAADPRSSSRVPQTPSDDT
jgi:integrase